MYAVIVTFEVKHTDKHTFELLLHAQARNSLEKETDCHCFDIIIDNQNNNTFHLYELYTDASAFKRHLNSDHFKTFDQHVTPMIVHKKVSFGNKIAI